MEKDDSKDNELNFIERKKIVEKIMGEEPVVEIKKSDSLQPQTYTIYGTQIIRPENK